MDSDGLGMFRNCMQPSLADFLMKFISYQKICHRIEYMFSFCGNEYFQIHTRIFLLTSATCFGYLNVTIIRLRGIIKMIFFT